MSFVAFWLNRFMKKQFMKTQLLHPLTTNEHTVKDTFDVESLFTNVPLERTLQIIERRGFTMRKNYQRN